jgi:hypothetical protein
MRQRKYPAMRLSMLTRMQDIAYYTTDTRMMKIITNWVYIVASKFAILTTRITICTLIAFSERRTPRLDVKKGNSILFFGSFLVYLASGAGFTSDAMEI